MKCNCQRWFWGIIPLIILCWLAIHFERGRIEQDLAERAGSALMSSGHTWAVAAVEGRDIVLSGRAPDEDEPGKASELVRGTWGVRLVDNRVDLLERAENYIWAASRRGQRIRLTGYAPNLATRQVIIGVARANFPGFEIVDRTRLARGVPPLDTWLAGISFSLRQLASLKRGDVRLDGLSMTVTGEAEDLTEYRAVRTALASGLPKAIKLANNLIAAPSVSPHTLSARLNGGELTLTGYAPDEAAADELVRLISNVAPGLPINNRLQPASGAPTGWGGVAAAGVRALLNLKNGSAELKDTTLTLSAIAANDTELQATRTALRAELGEPFRLTDHIKLPQPLILPPTPPVPPLPAELVPPSVAPKAAEPSPPTEPPAQVSDLVLPQPPPLPPPPPELAPGPAPEPASPPPSTPAPALVMVAPAPPPDPGERPLPPSSPAGSQSIATQSLPPAVPAPAVQDLPPPATSMVAAADPTAIARASACQERQAKIADAGPILFRVGSADLDSAGIVALDGVAGAAKACPELRIEIAGHASAEGGQDRNQQLSLERARTAFAYLVKAGVEEQRLEAVGYGASRPTAANDGRDGMARSRRVEFVVRH